MKKKICLCSSRKFFDRLWPIKEELERLGYDVLLPSMKNFQDNFLKQKGEEDARNKIHYDLIRKHFKKIDESDAIVVCNFEKKGIKGHIGGNSFMEMSKAFDKGIPIFLLNSIPQVNYRDEIVAMQPIVISDLCGIKEHMEAR